MAAATRALKVDIYPRAGRDTYPVVNGDTVYPHTLVGLNPSSGMLTPWADTAGLLFKGLALDGQTTSKEVEGDGTAALANQMRVDESGVVIRDVNVTGSSALTDHGSKVYCSTDNPADFTLSATSNAKAVGEVIRWKTSTTCDVRLYTPWEYRLQVLASDITALTSNLGGSESPDGTISAIADIALSTSDTYTDAAVNAAVNAVVDDVENALEEVVAKLGEIVTALNGLQ